MESRVWKQPWRAARALLIVATGLWLGACLAGCTSSPPANTSGDQPVEPRPAVGSGDEFRTVHLDDPPPPVDETVEREPLSGLKVSPPVGEVPPPRGDLTRAELELNAASEESAGEPGAGEEENPIASADEEETTPGTDQNPESASADESTGDTDETAATEPGAAPGDEPAPAHGADEEAAPVTAPPVTESRPAPRGQPEDGVLRRNLDPGGRNRYRFDLNEAIAVDTIAAGNAVQIQLASGRKIRVPAGGEPIFDALRDSREPISGKERFNDVVAGYVVVAGLDDPSILNSVIKNIAAYRGIFEKLNYSFYDKTTSLPTAPFADRFAANHAEVRASLEPWGFDVKEADSRFVLDIIIGKGNWVEKAEVSLEMISTSYELRDTDGELVRIVNENWVVKPDARGGTQEQNVVWVLQHVPGVGTLARYYQASESVNKPVGPKENFKNVRFELVQRNVEEYLKGIHDATRQAMVTRRR